jgi:hypothetical protein
MSVIVTRGVIQQGQVEVKEPINLPDGTEVSLAISEPVRSEADSDELWEPSPAEVANWLAWYEALEPLVITAAEEAEAEAWLKQTSAHGASRLRQCTMDLFE